MSRFSNFSDRELSQIIHGLETQGHPGRINELLHEANYEPTDRMSDSQLMEVVAFRKATGQGADKARPALKARGYSY